MSKNKKVTSVSIDPEFHEELKDYAKKRGIKSVSSLICQIMSKVVKLSIYDEPMIVGKPVNEEVLPVLLKIPANLRGDKEGLKSWMDAQTSGIVNKLAES